MESVIREQNTFQEQRFGFNLSYSEVKAVSVHPLSLTRSLINTEYPNQWIFFKAEIDS